LPLISLNGYRALGAIPSQRTLVLERFFDESGGMQLVLHSPSVIESIEPGVWLCENVFVARSILSCRLPATDDAIVISLGTQHSFPLEEVFTT